MKKIFITLALILVSCTTCAQVYNFKYNFIDKDVHLCTTEDDNCLYMKGFFQIYSYNFTLRAVDAKTSLDLLFDLPELITLFEVSGKSRVGDKNCFIQIELSNGNMLRSNTENAILGDRIVFISSGSITVNNKKLNDNGYYVMSLLRTYDIVNFIVDGASIKAPEIHTADTFDAMCKTLIAKAGDKGQYGKRLTNSNNTALIAQKTRPTPSTPSTNRTQKNTPKPNNANSQTSTNSVDLNKMNAANLKAEAEKGNSEAMYILGCRYHDGQLAGIEKNDRLSYQWLMTYCHVSNEKDGEKALDYIKNNLKRNNTTLNPSFEYLTKETNLTPMDFILHPLAYFPTSAIFMKEANMEREITTKRQMTISTSYKKKFDKGEIDIWERGNLGKMPKLLNKEVWKMKWSSKNKKYATYDFDFHFGNRNEAETFLYTIAYETMQEGVFWEKSGYKTPRKIDENIDFGYTTYLTIKGKRYYVPITLYLFDIKNAKPEERYTIAIHVSLVQSK